MKTTLILLLISTQAFANFARLSSSGFSLPADDLIYQGERISPEKARKLKRQGFDISTLDPAVEKRGLWVNKLGESLNSDLDQMNINEGDSVSFQGTLRSAPGEFRFSVTTSDRDIITLYADKKLHTTLLRKNFLRKLGYIVPSIKYLKSVSVTFKSEAEKENFITKFRRGAEGTTKRWIETDLGLTLVLRDIAAVQVSDTDLYNPAFGVPGGALNSRKLRALVVPYALLDLKESVNKFSWSVGRKENSDRIILPHFFSNNNFMTTTIEDATWISRRLETLSREDFEEAVKLSYFPSPVASLVVEKLLSRRNALLKLFKVNHEKIKVDNKVSEMPHLLNGKILKQQWRDYGYAAEFAAGDASSPFKDFHYYIYSMLQSIGIDSIISRANDELALFDPLKARMALAEEEFIQGLNHFVETGEFLQFPVSTWTSPIVNGNLILSRDVVVGNYLGTENLVQLADTFGYAMSLGAIMGIENVDVLDAVTMSASATYLKTFTHLKPLSSLKDVFKQSYKNLAVILLKKDLRKYLKQAIDQSPDGENVDVQTEYFSSVVENISKALGVGESLIVSEKIMPKFSASAKIPITQTGFVVGVGAGAEYIGVKRLQILRRDANTIQIYDDVGSAKGADFSLSLENRIPIIRFEYKVLKGKYKVKAFRVNLNADAEDNPSFMRGIEAFHSLLTTNSSELLEEMAEDKVGPASSELEANFKDKYSKFAFLFWRKQRNRGFTDYKVSTSAGLSGEYITHYDFNRKGLNWESFTKDVIQYGLSKWTRGQDIVWRNNIWQIPSDTFGGRANVTESNYEGQLRNDKIGKEYMSFGRRYEGWSKKQRKLKKIVTKLNDRFQLPLFTPAQIDDIKKLYMYDILVQMNIYDRGVKAIKNLTRNELIYYASYFDKQREFQCREEFQQVYDFATTDGEVVQVATCGRISTAIRLVEVCPTIEELKKQTQCWLNVAKDLFKGLPFIHFAHHIVGRNNFYVEGTVNGFRRNDEILNDPIRSNGFGRRHPVYPFGLIRKAQQRVGIQNGEFTGQWLREQP